MLKFIKTFSITKFVMISVALIVAYNVSTLFFMVNREMQIGNIDPEILTQIQSHNILVTSEKMVGTKILSRFEQNSFLIITDKRFLIVNNWQVQSINLSDIVEVSIVQTFLGFDIVKIQTKDSFFDTEIEHKHLENVIKILQVDPKIVTYKTHTDKPA